MVGSRLSICLIVQLLVTSSSVYTTAKPRVEKDIKSVQWPSGHGCTIVDGLVCGEDLEYFCELETGICSKCEEDYCNALLSTSERCEERCPAYYQQGYYTRNIVGKPTGNFRLKEPIVAGSFSTKNESTTRHVGSLHNIINKQTNNKSNSGTSSKNKDNSLQVKIPKLKSDGSSWSIFTKVISVISVAIFVTVLAILGFLLNKKFGLKRKITSYFDKRSDNLPIPATNLDDNNSQVELEENIDVIIDHPTDDNTDSYPFEHNILHPEEREKLGLIVKVDIDAEPVSTSTHLLDSSATACCSRETSKAEQQHIQST